MQLPSPNLDDRTFEDLVEEARRRITALCPQWTDFNPSDPGMTLVELMAWMTELLIYRINRVPEKSYIEFLNLMGVRLRPPQAARTWVIFEAAAGAAKNNQRLEIRKGAKLSTAGGQAEPVQFETTAALHLTPARILLLGSKDKQHHQTFKVPDGAASQVIPLFCGDKTAIHRLYLGDANLSEMLPDTNLRLHLSVGPEGESDVLIEWECWNGRQWEIVVPSVDETLQWRQSGIIRFDRLPEPAPKAFQGHTTCWLRACLLSSRGRSLPRIENLQRSFAMKTGMGRAPDTAFMEIQPRTKEDEKIRKPIDLIGDFHPFGTNPFPGDTFNLASRLFEKKAARMAIQVSLSPQYRPDTGEALKSLKVAWEYVAAGGQWELLGLTTPANVEISKSDFQDATEAFTHSGAIQFLVPSDMTAIDLNGQPRFLIRARIVEGSYGQNPPILGSIRLRFEEKEKTFDQYWTENDFQINDCTPQALKLEPFAPFEFAKDADPAFYVALDQPLENNLQRVYLRLAEAVNGWDIDLVWEYSGPHGWSPLNLKSDSTGKLCHSGAIEFNGPADWTPTEQFNLEGYWLRARWIGGRWQTMPSLVGVHLNAAPVIAAETRTLENLGTSNGQPFQVFHLSKRPILPDPQIFVREQDGASAEQLQTLAAHMDVDDYFFPETGGPGIWIRWQVVDNFYQSDPLSRHFLLDPYKGTITFGNGIKGRIPPVGTDNVMARSYLTGGGARGNVGADCITTLKSPYPSIRRVSNPVPATGGADAESVAEARLRGPWMLKHRHRAVTLEDFEQLALDASSQVAKATCTSDGKAITVVIIPKGEEPILQPGVMLVQRVRDFLDRRRLITTRLHVRGPEYIGVDIHAEIVLKTSAALKSQGIQDAIEVMLNTFFHPINGGPEGQGWPMGRSVHLSEIYYLLEKADGVDYVRSVVLNADTYCKRIGLEACHYPFLKSARIAVV